VAILYFLISVHYSRILIFIIGWSFSSSNRPNSYFALFNQNIGQHTSLEGQFANQFDY